MTVYAKDPRTMTARYASKCPCGSGIAKGDEIFYYPIGKKAYGSKCGCADSARRDFEAHAFDEDYA